MTMNQDYERKVVRACLAALARRSGVGLLVSYSEIGREMDNDTTPEIICDGDAKCARIYVPEGL
jgi:hypothetical protein